LRCSIESPKSQVPSESEEHRTIFIFIFARDDNCDNSKLFKFKNARKWLTMSLLPTMDGNRDTLYGSAVVLQKVNSAFANSDGGAPHQIAAAYAFVDADARALYLFLAGNVNHGGAKLHLFIDGLDGENTLRTPHEYDGSRSRNLVNLTFDAGFDARFHLFARLTASSTLAATLIDRSTMLDNGVADFNKYSGGSRQFNVAPIANTDGLAWFFGNNSNGAGVAFDPSGNTAPPTGAAESVTTGWEFSFNLSFFDGKLRDPNRLSICAMIGTDDFVSMSNQVLGSMPLGYKSALSAGLNLTAVDGAQYFDVALAPTSRSGFVAATAESKSRLTANMVTISSASAVNNSLRATSAPADETTMQFASQSSPQALPLAAIVGGIVASVVFVFVTVAVLRWFLLREKSKRSPVAQAPQGEYASTFAALQ
jgi:hypothetical protein